MNIKKNNVFHQKSKSINNQLSLKDFYFHSNSLNGQPINEQIYSNTNKNLITELKFKDKKNTSNNINNNPEEKNEEINFVKTIDEMKQNVLDLYYDKNSPFKKKVDDLNLKFYLETEKYLKNSKINDQIRNQKLQANLFIILFQQINILIEEIERLNKIILDHKFQKETILKRTNELNEKKQNILIKDNLILSLKKSNTNIEKKLLETLLHEDKLIKDNERLRKENETYKTLTIVFENELKNTIRKNGLTPQKNHIPHHIKTYSDYGVSSNSIINELCGHSMNNTYEEKFETITNENKFTTRENEKSLYNKKIGNKEFYSPNNKYNNSLNIDKKPKHSIEINKIEKYNKNIKDPILTENISIKNKEKKNLIKFTPSTSNSNRQKLKKSQDNKIKTKKDISNNNRTYDCSNNKNAANNNKNVVNNNNNLCSNFVYNNNKNQIIPHKNKKLILIKKKNNNINIDSISNNINPRINSNNTMTETNNLSCEKKKDKKIQKLESQKVGYHKKQKTMNEMSFNEIVRVQIVNDEVNNNANNIANIPNNTKFSNNKNNNKIIIKNSDGKNNIKKSPHNTYYKKSNNKNF